MNTGISSHSPVRHKPQSVPRPTPRKADSTTPSTSGCSVERYAFGRLPSAISPTKATNVSEKVGNAKLTGMRPATSQTAAKSTIETSLRRTGWSRHPPASPYPERGARPTASLSVLMLLAISRAYFLPSLARARSRAATSQKSSTFRVAASPSIWPARLKNAKSSAAASAPPPFSTRLPASAVSL